MKNLYRDKENFSCVAEKKKKAKNNSDGNFVGENYFMHAQEEKFMMTIVIHFKSHEWQDFNI